MIRTLFTYFLQNIRVANRLKLMIRILLTCLILWLILKSTNRQQTWSILKNADIKILGWAILAQLASTTLAAYRWQLIMHNLQFGLGFHFYWRSYFKGMFFNQALPTSIGGDAVKILDLSRKYFRKRDAFYGVMIDRIIGLVALLALSLFAYILSPDILPERVYVVILWLNVSALIGFFSLRFIYKIPLFRNVPKLSDFLQTISQQLAKTFLRHKLQIFTSSLLIPFLAVLGFFLTGWSLGLRYDLMTYFLIIPPAIVFTILPVSIAGWGIREGALVTLFSMVGADTSIVLMMSIAYGFTLILVSMPGLYIFLRGRHAT